MLKVDALCCMNRDRWLFSRLSFHLEPGKSLIVTGPNGAGKSTLLQLLSGFFQPDSGDIFWQGQPIATMGSEFKNQLHYLGHKDGIKADLTVNENLKWLQHLAFSCSTPTASILSSLQLTEEQHTPASCLSSGQKRRLALAKLILIRRPLWLLDEPLTALDTDAQTLFLSWLAQHLTEGGVAVISSHHAIENKQLAHQVLRL